MKSDISVLLIAEAANPEWVSVPLEGWSHSQAIASLVHAHVVTQIRNRDAIQRAGWVEGREFTAINSDAVARPVHQLSQLLRGGSNKGWTMVTAMKTPMNLYFERLVWKRFGADIRSGRYDLVHRVTPLSPTTPSPLAGKCRGAGVPFVLGPLNGGLPWPKGFDHTRRKEREWLSYVRSAHKLMPGYHATRRHTSAIIIGSRATYEQVPAVYLPKCVYIPENAIDPQRFTTRPADSPVQLPLRVAFLGRLVPYKGADMLIEASAQLAREKKLVLDIIGDGPEMPHLKQLVAQHQIESAVRLDGFVPHEQVQDRLVQSDIFAFPSIREFGGAVVLEAMALGLVPVVVDYGGPGELVSSATGYAVPLGSRASLIAAFRHVLEGLVDQPGGIPEMGQRARRRVEAQFTWQAKARQVLEVYEWVLGQKPKPDFGMPLADSVCGSLPG